MALGYERVGRVEFGDGASLTMLKFPYEEVVTLELAHRPTAGRVELGSGFSHLPIQVDDLEGLIEALLKAGVKPGPIEHPGGAEGPRVAWLVDPDGYRIELVQWPAGHPYGLTPADFQ